MYSSSKIQLHITATQRTTFAIGPQLCVFFYMFFFISKYGPNVDLIKKIMTEEVCEYMNCTSLCQNNKRLPNGHKFEERDRYGLAVCTRR